MMQPQVKSKVAHDGLHKVFPISAVFGESPFSDDAHYRTIVGLEQSYAWGDPQSAIAVTDLQERNRNERIKIKATLRDVFEILADAHKHQTIADLTVENLKARNVFIEPKKP